MSPAGTPDDAPFGVVDIGSNSVRLVVFRRISRNPRPLFNEKVLCGIGRGMVSTGALHRAGTVRALQALGRFRTLIDGMGVWELQVVATAAVRDASNGDEFVADATNEIGVPVRILTGKEEARLAAYGVLSGIPDADGLVGDLGGGSLELMEISNGQLSNGATFPLGPLRLMDAAESKVKIAKDFASETLKKAKWLKDLKGRRLYLVGGIWRNFSSILLNQQDHPLPMLQNFVARSDDARELAQALAGLSAEALEDVPKLSSRRREAMPYGAVVLDRLIKLTGVSHVVTSSFGVREGVLFEQLDDDFRSHDPLIEGASDFNVQFSRSPGHANELHLWITPLFETWPEPLKRFVHAACFLSDIGWRDHEDFRAATVFDRVLTAPIAGISHEARAFLALAVFVRYGGRIHNGAAKPARALLSADLIEKATALGLAMRVAYRVSGAVAGLLPLTSIRIEEDRLVLTINRQEGPLSGEIVLKRLTALGQALELTERIEFV